MRQATAARADLGSLIEDYALERVPDGERELAEIAWNICGPVTTL
jgi:hypothetical protein